MGDLTPEARDELRERVRFAVSDAEWLESPEGRETYGQARVVLDLAAAVLALLDEVERLNGYVRAHGVAAESWAEMVQERDQTIERLREQLTNIADALSGTAAMLRQEDPTARYHLWHTEVGVSEPYTTSDVLDVFCLAARAALSEEGTT